MSGWLLWWCGKPSTTAQSTSCTLSVVFAFLAQVKLLVGMSKAAFGKTQPEVLISIVWATSIALLVQHGLFLETCPCIFIIVNRLRSFGFVLSICTPPLSAVLLGHVLLLECLVALTFVALFIVFRNFFCDSYASQAFLVNQQKETIMWCFQDVINPTEYIYSRVARVTATVKKLQFYEAGSGCSGLLHHHPHTPPPSSSPPLSCGSKTKIKKMIASTRGLVFPSLSFPPLIPVARWATSSDNWRK